MTPETMIEVPPIVNRENQTICDPMHWLSFFPNQPSPPYYQLGVSGFRYLVKFYKTETRTKID